MTARTIRLICLLASLALILLAFLWEPESPTLPGSAFRPSVEEPKPEATLTPVRSGISRGGRSEVLAARAVGRPTSTPAAMPTPAPVHLGEFRLTAYSDSPRNGTAGRGITRSGEPTRWGVVAVDPKLIPLRSRLLIAGWEGMEFAALDTGGGVKGRHVDLWLPNDDLALGWGSRMANVWRVAP